MEVEIGGDWRLIGSFVEHGEDVGHPLGTLALVCIEPRGTRTFEGDTKEMKQNGVSPRIGQFLPPFAPKTGHSSARGAQGLTCSAVP